MQSLMRLRRPMALATAGTYESFHNYCARQYGVKIWLKIPDKAGQALLIYNQ